MAHPTASHRVLHHRFGAMASQCEIVLARPDDAGLRDTEWARHAGLALDAAQAEVQRIEQRFSRYRSDSVVGRINASAGSGQPVGVDEETAGLLDFAASLHAASGGLFDITSGLLSLAWDFRRARLPEPGALHALCQRVGWQRVDWQPAQRRISLPEPGMALDFGGFGKEYAADRAQAELQRRGLTHGYVNLGGDIRVLGPQPDGQAWRFAIQHPRLPGHTVAHLALARGALATSGDYERFFEQGGRRYCHILHPHTGWPVTHWQSVSVVAPLCAAAGALTTMAMLLQDQALPMLRDNAAQFLAIGPDGELVHEGGLEPSAAQGVA